MGGDRERVHDLAGCRIDGLKGHLYSPTWTGSDRKPRRSLLLQSSDYEAAIVALKAASSSSVVKISCAYVGASMSNAACIASGVSIWPAPQVDRLGDAADQAATASRAACQFHGRRSAILFAG
jgi:hypothetical protein